MLAGSYMIIIILFAACYDVTLFANIILGSFWEVFDLHFVINGDYFSLKFPSDPDPSKNYAKAI